MIDERSRAAQFFKYYQPVVEQEITLIAEIEQLQSIMEETTKQCANPTMLPEISEDSINAYKVPEYLVPGRSREHGGVVSFYSTFIFIVKTGAKPIQHFKFILDEMWNDFNECVFTWFFPT